MGIQFCVFLLIFIITRPTLLLFLLQKLLPNTANIEVANICNLDSCVTNDRMVIHYYELTYPRQFHFGNATSFEFSLPASAAGNYLEIKGFSNPSGAPVRLLRPYQWSLVLW